MCVKFVNILDQTVFLTTHIFSAFISGVQLAQKCQLQFSKSFKMSKWPNGGSLLTSQRCRINSIVTSKYTHFLQRNIFLCSPLPQNHRSLWPSVMFYLSVAHIIKPRSHFCKTNFGYVLCFYLNYQQSYWLNKWRDCLFRWKRKYTFLFNDNYICVTNSKHRWFVDDCFGRVCFIEKNVVELGNLRLTEIIK